MKNLDLHSFNDVLKVVSAYGGYFNFVKFVESHKEESILLTTEQFSRVFTPTEFDRVLSQYRLRKNIFDTYDHVVIRENKYILFKDPSHKDKQNSVFNVSDPTYSIGPFGDIEGLVELIDKDGVSCGYVSSNLLRLASNKEIENDIRID